jgi:hypothetical protein
VSNATLGRGSDVVALQLGLLVGRDSYVEAYIGGKGLPSTSGRGKSHPKSLSRLARRTGTHLQKGESRTDRALKLSHRANDLKHSARAEDRQYRA